MHAHKYIFLIILFLGFSTIALAKKECPMCGKIYSDDKNYCTQCEDTNGNAIKLRILQNAESPPRPKPPSIRANVIVEGDSILITSELEQANVYLDEEYEGMTPIILKMVANGAHIVKLSCEEYPDYIKTVEINFSGEELYNQSYLDFYRGAYNLAIEGFRSYLERFPNTPKSDSAQYYIGESFLSKNEYETAIKEYKKVLSNYPKSKTVPTVVYIIGLCYERLKRNEDARTFYEKVVEFYPNSFDAARAREKLKDIKKIIKADFQINGNKVTIESNPSEIDVHLDGTFKGNTPLILKKVKPGSHTIKLNQNPEYPDYETYTKNISITQPVSSPHPFLYGLYGASLSAVMPGLGQGKFKQKTEFWGCGLIRTSTYGFYIAGLCCLIDVFTKPTNLLTNEDKKDYNNTVKIELYTTIGFYTLNILEGYLAGRKYAHNR